MGCTAAALVRLVEARAGWSHPLLHLIQPPTHSRTWRRLDSDIVSLLGKRVYDMAGVLGKSVKVQLNGEKPRAGSCAT